ncbi:MAG: Gfo/Idh/MocA family oxidoreductase [Eubacteriales bacterium]
MEQKKLRIGIIGTGGIAHAHAAAYKSFNDVEIVAAADIIPGKARAFLDEFGWNDAAAYDNHEELCRRDDIDAVSVCTYNTQHAVCAVAALESGKHVLLEKPMAVTLDEGIAIMRAEKKSGKLISIGFQPRYNENCKKMKRIVESGELGKVYYVQVGGSRRRGIPGSTFIEHDKASFGAIGDLGCYSLDLSLNTIGYPTPLTVSAYTSDYFGKNPKYYGESERFSVDDFSAAFIRLEGDIILDYRMAWAMHMDKCSDFVVLGTDAGMKATVPTPAPLWGSVIDGTIGGLYLMHDEMGEPVTTELSQVPTNGNIFTMKVRDFLDAVKEGRTTAPIPTSQIIKNQAIIDAMVRSAAEKCEIKIDIPKI